MKNSLGNKEVMAQNIKYYMRMRGLNQTEFCKLLNFKMATLSDWLNAKTYPRIDKIEMMANFFGIDKSNLVENFNHESEKFIVSLPSSMEEQKLLKDFNKLNSLGKNKATDLVHDLTEIKRYTTKYEVDTIAAHNDYLDEHGEMDRIREDLDEMDTWE